jgi:hypothetical protein
MHTTTTATNPKYPRAITKPVRFKDFWILDKVLFKVGLPSAVTFSKNG